MEETILDPDRRRVSEGVLGGMDTTWVMISSGEQCIANIPTMVQGAGYKDSTSQQKLSEEAPSAPRSALQPDALTLEPIGPRVPASLRERTEAPLPPPRPRRKFIHPKQLSPFPERLELPFPSEAMRMWSPRAQTNSPRG